MSGGVAEGRPALGKELSLPCACLCRGSGTRQRVFDEGHTLGKERPSAKTLCQAPDPRQRQTHGNNNSLPRAKPSAKVRPSTTPPHTTSIPCRQSLPRASPLGPRQRLFILNFFFKFSMHLQFKFEIVEKIQ